jgi:hypothetical protein
LRDYASPPGAHYLEDFPVSARILLQYPVVNKYKDENLNTLGVLISLYAGKNCMDPRDKIYGLLGLTYDTHLPMVDYSKSLTEVFVDTINALHDEYWTRSFGLSDGVLEFTAVQSTDDRPRPSYMLVAYFLQSLKSDNL